VHPPPDAFSSWLLCAIDVRRLSGVIKNLLYSKVDLVPLVIVGSGVIYVEQVLVFLVLLLLLLRRFGDCVS
jgi:hypothetical protein